MARRMIAGSIRITTDGAVNAMVAGDVTVAAGCRVAFRGMIGGDLIVEPGAEIVGRAMIAGDVRNDGGRVAVSGMTGSGMAGRG